MKRSIQKIDQKNDGKYNRDNIDGGKQNIHRLITPTLRGRLRSRLGGRLPGAGIGIKIEEMRIVAVIIHPHLGGRIGGGV